MAIGGSVRLVIEQGSKAGQSVPLRGGAIVVGRGEGSDLRLLETGISRQHARFQPSPEGWSLVDLHSTNGTFVNGRRLPPEHPYLLRPGDRVAIGNTLLTVLPDEGEPAVPEEILAEGVGSGGERGGKPRPVLLAIGAVGLVVVLVGIVILLVTLLQPEAGPVTPTVAGPLDQITTAFPVPTEFEGVMTSVATLLPTGFPRLPVGPTPTPEAKEPGLELAQGPPLPAAPGPLPVPFTRAEMGDRAP
jgi:pSer/pThr/pTyr-binding forkhead associated (FHA) protein